MNDTVGAGDSFSGTFTGKILTGSTLVEAHRAAVNTKAEQKGEKLPLPGRVAHAFYEQMVRTTSVAVAPEGISPESLKPTTRGISMETGWPSMAASASIPPTPQPSTPRPLTIVVWESVPTQVSG